ncbi:MAG: hypothetical protein ACP5P4_05155 [Steroidobacteraceae bacterium]
MTAPPGNFGNWSPQSFATDYQSVVFMIEEVIARGATCAWVQVLSCSNSGTVAASGTVTVQPLVNQMTGSGQAVPHGQIAQMPFVRLQGGDSATILDPVAGDIGLAIFASRDSSLVRKAALGVGLALGRLFNPGSKRQYSWSDGVYLGGILTKTPTQYVQYLPNGGGVNIKSTGPVNINGAVISAAGEITDANGIVLGTHDHTPGTYVAPSGGGPITGNSGAPVA